MSGTRRGARVGAAVVAAGLSLAGPQALGLAAAEAGEAAGESGSAAVSADSDAVRGGDEQGSRREPRAGRVAVGQQRGDAAAGRRVGGSVAQVAASAMKSSDSGRASVAHPGRAAAAVASAIEPAAEPPAAPIETAAADASAVAPAAYRDRGTASAPGVGQSIAGANAAVAGFLDTVERLLSGLPANPVSDFLAGALQLMRRGLFNQAPTAAPRVQVGEVLRPMAAEQGVEGDSVFSTSLIGELAGSLGATDPEGAELSYALSKAPQFGAVRIDADGTWTYTPTDSSAAVPDSFTVSINDGGWNILDPFRSPDEVTIRVQPGLVASSANKPGLIASDWLEIVKTTGEIGGDEAVMVTVLLTTTLGVENSTSVKMVDDYPNEFGKNLDPGNKIRIPDQDGDMWISYKDQFKPFGLAAIAAAQLPTVPLRIPLIFAVTMMFEGDFSPSSGYIDLGKLSIGSRLFTVGKELEKIKIYIAPDEATGKVDTAAIQKALDDARASIAAKVELTTSVIRDVVLLRIKQWNEAAGDPDDPVGLGVTALIPLDDTMTTPSAFFGGNPAIESLKNRQVCVEAVSCYVDRIDVTEGGYDYYSNDTTVLITAADGKGSGATARAVLAPHPQDSDMNDIVARVDVTNRGSGYLSPPTVYIGGSGYGAEAKAVLGGGLRLNDEYVGSYTTYLRNTFFDADIPIRYGFLLPPGALGTTIQGWQTTYAGDYLDNDWAEWKVETQGWSRINW